MLKILQINLQHCKMASVELLLTLEEGHYDVALVQEPWISSGNEVSGLKLRSFNTYFPKTVSRIRSAILVRKSLCSHILSNYSTDDLTVVAIEDVKDGAVLFASCYMAHNIDAPPVELQKLVDEASKKKLNLVVGTDANAHHVIWGSKDINLRGESLITFILQSNLYIANRGEVPTYKGPTSENVLDLTLFNDERVIVDEWRVLLQPSFSDHRYISFRVRFGQPNVKVFRNPRKTDWTKYETLMNRQLRDQRTITDSVDIDSVLDELVTSVVGSYEASCRPTRTSRRSKLPWWNGNLDAERREVRELFKLARTADQPECWGEYKDALRSYKGNIRRAKRSSWKKFCGNIESSGETTRLRKMLAGKPTMQSTICRDDGEWTNDSEETLSVLLNAHFPGCTEVTDLSSITLRTLVDEDRDIITYERVKWAINSFQPYK